LKRLGTISNPFAGRKENKGTEELSTEGRKGEKDTLNNWETVEKTKNGEG